MLRVRAECTRREMRLAAEPPSETRSMYVGDDVDPDTVRTPRDMLAVRRLVARLRKGRDARTHMISRVKHAIGEGEYENDLKLSVAIDRLLEELPASHEKRK